ncbi:MAG: hypothetical protein AB1515_02125 [Nitrospirota bacterium]
MTIEPNELEELQEIVESLEGCLGRMQELNFPHPVFRDVFVRCCEATDRLDELVAHYAGEEHIGSC